MRSFEIIVIDADTCDEIWRGPFDVFVADNSLTPEESDALIFDLGQEAGHACIGGGASPLYLIMAPSFLEDRPALDAQPSQDASELAAAMRAPTP